jgi:hypothetical protein
MTQNAFSTTDLNRLQRQLSGWRRRQAGRARLPETVWKAATELARTQSPSRVARTLQLDYYKLRERLAGTSLLQRTTPAFVEVKSPWVSEAPTDQAAVELSDGTGARMTLRVGSDLSTLLALAQSFWRRA